MILIWTKSKNVTPVPDGAGCCFNENKGNKMENSINEVMHALTDAGFKPVTRNDGLGDDIQVSLSNGYVLDIARNMGTYGNEDGLWEGAMMLNGHLVYPEGSPCKDDVLGYLDTNDIVRFAKDAAKCGKARE